MKKKGVINRIMGGLMVLIFAIGVTPKIYFHDILFDHEDQLFETPVKGKSYTSYKFSCGFVNIVSDSSFTEPRLLRFAATPKTAAFRTTCLPGTVKHCFTEKKALRGPPGNS